jgi:hypothetical protein
MFRWCILVFAVSFCTVISFARSARAELRIQRLPILPSFVPSKALKKPGDASPPTATSRSGGIFASLMRTLETRAWSPGPLRHQDAPRNPAIRDPQRDRDATSLGVVHGHAHVSGIGAALAGGGLLGEAGKTLGKGIGVSLGPVLMLGGGGLRFKATW